MLRFPAWLEFQGLWAMNQSWEQADLCCAQNGTANLFGLTDDPRYTYEATCVTCPASQSGYPRMGALWKDPALTGVWALRLQNACCPIADIQSARTPKVQDHEPRHVVETAEPIGGNTTPTVIPGRCDRVQKYLPADYLVADAAVPSGLPLLLLIKPRRT